MGFKVVIRIMIEVAARAHKGPESISPVWNIERFGRQDSLMGVQVITWIRASDPVAEWHT
jgi:hypothetical protein